MQPNPIVVVLTDGLGNQMFQYATARALAKRRSLPLVVDPQSGFRWNIHGRQYELGAFRLTATEADTRAGRLVHALIRKAEDAAMRRGAYYLPPLHAWLTHATHRVTGFFQSPSYFDDAAAEIRSEFQLREPPPAAVAALAASARGKESVGFHVRLQHAFAANGEKVTPQFSGRRYEDELAAYYRAAVRHIQQHVPAPHWIVVTDTPSFEPSTIGLPPDVTVHRPVPSALPAVDQWLLSQCKHLVVGRSTFSWWAAWLSGERRGITCAPRVFYPGGTPAESRAIYPAQWTIL